MTRIDHLVLVMYAGDFDDAYRRWTTGEDPHYRTHPQILEMTSKLALDNCRTTIVTCVGSPSPLASLEDGVDFRRLGVVPHEDPAAVNRAVDELDPSHLVVHFPQIELLDWASSEFERFRTASINASSFSDTRSLTLTGIRNRLRTNRVVKALNSPNIELIANHGRPATESFRAAGVDRDRLLAYDFVQDINPDQNEPRTLRDGAADAPRLFTVGFISEAKGVHDAIASLADPSWGDRRPVLRIAGTGEDEAALDCARAHGVVEQVTFLGSIGNGQVQAEMRDADLVVIPSRPSFPEGFPLTMFEAVASRTPIVASDHPVFVSLLRDERDVVMFSAGQPAALAAAVQRALDPIRYRERSQQVDAAWDALQVPLKWGDLITRWRAGDRGPILAEHGLN